MNSIHMTFLYRFIKKYLLIEVEYLVLQGYFTLKLDKNRVKSSKRIFQFGVAPIIIGL